MAHRTATTEDLHHLCPWVVSATHDVGGRWSLLSVCLSFFCFLLGGYALRRAQGCMAAVCTAFGPIGLSSSRLYLRCPCIHSIRLSLYPHHKSCKGVYCKKGNNRKRTNTSSMPVPAQGEKLLSHPESRIARLSSIALSGCCCSCYNSPVTTFPSRLATVRECPSRAKRHPFGQDMG